MSPQNTKSLIETDPTRWFSGLDFEKQFYTEYNSAIELLYFTLKRIVCLPHTIKQAEEQQISRAYTVLYEENRAN